tara:strand:+ start:1128 stop:1289 length:162 start_codon:yes stop_codon:yes gene_type:complete
MNYDYDFNVRPITRYIHFLFCNEIYNLEKNYLPNYKDIEYIENDERRKEGLYS